MRKNNLTFWVGLLFLASVSMLPGCELVGDIFKAGYYVGIFVVIVVVLLIYWLVSFFRRR